MRSLMLVALLALAAGCVSNEAPVESAATADSVIGAPATVPVDFAGTTGAGAVVYVPSIAAFGAYAGNGGAFACAVGCVPVPVAPVDGLSYASLEWDGTLDAIDLTVEWSASRSTTETLMLGFSHEPSDGYALVATGTSPLVLHQGDLGIEDNDGFLSVWVPCQNAAGIWTCESEPQDFTIKGTLTTLPAATAPAETAE